MIRVTLTQVGFDEYFFPRFQRGNFAASAILPAEGGGYPLAGRSQFLKCFLIAMTADAGHSAIRACEFTLFRATQENGHE